MKRALPRFSASIPERLIVTNRLVVQDCYKYDPIALRNYFQKFGHIKKFDYEQGFVDFDVCQHLNTRENERKIVFFFFKDYDDVDRVLIGRPHFIRNREVLVTKYIPSEQTNRSTRSTHRSDPDEQEEASYPSPTRDVKLSRTIRIERHTSTEVKIFI